MKFTALILILLLLVGCVGTHFKWDDARKITPGMTTTEVTKLIGTPNNITSRNGTLIYVWVYMDSLMSTRTLRIDFKNDKAITAPPIPDSFQD